jgi:hypothetical protein
MWAYLVIGIAVALLVVAGTAWAVMANRRSERLRSMFSSEYDRTVAASKSRHDAEYELREREKRRERLNIKPLSTATRERYADRWRSVQGDFVDAPEVAVRDANQLVQLVMSDRGYPIDDFEQQAADISVDHGDVVARYRAAYAIWLRSEDGLASTEELRQAMRHYRSLFDELLEDRGAPAGRERAHIEEAAVR